jgi:predicted PurR-regulated permease PerM
LLLGTVSAVGNFFIVLFLGLAFAAQPERLSKGVLFMAPARHRARATVIVDRIGETLERWLMAQIITMFAGISRNLARLAIIGIPARSSWVQAGLLHFIPTVGALMAG